MCLPSTRRIVLCLAPLALYMLLARHFHLLVVPICTSYRAASSDVALLFLEDIGNERINQTKITMNNTDSVMPIMAVEFSGDSTLCFMVGLVLKFFWMKPTIAATKHAKPPTDKPAPSEPPIVPPKYRSASDSNNRTTGPSFYSLIILLLIKNDTARCLTPIHKPTFAEMFMRCRFWPANHIRMRIRFIMKVRQANYITI